MSTKTTRPELWLSLLWALLLIFGLSGCDGDDGNDGADGAPGRDATVSSTAVAGDEIVAAINEAGRQVDAVVELPASGPVPERGDSLTFSGTLTAVDPLMRNIFIEDATLT